jgi:hypothetical protein
MGFDWKNLFQYIVDPTFFGLNDLWSGNEISEFIP